MLRPDTTALTVLLALLTAIGPLSVDLYLPSLPEIGRALAAPASQVQLTISSYLVGFAAGQIVYGPVSDLFGRKPVMFVALVIFCAASLACAGAPNIESLIAARVVQAVGASGAVVLARAVVRDLYEGARAGRELSVMAMIMGLAPVIAPTIGAALQMMFGWRACFLFICAGGVITIVAMWRFMPETLQRPAPGSFTAVQIVNAYRIVASDPGFLAHLALVAVSFAGLFAFISASPFVLQNFFGLTPVEFGVAFAVASTGYILGTSIAARLVLRAGLSRTIGVGAIALAAGGLASVITITQIPTSVIGLLLPMTLYLAGLGLAMPQALAGALQPFPERAGAASSLVGCVQQGLAAVIGAAVGHALSTTAWPLVLAVAIAGSLTLVLWIATQKVRRLSLQTQH